MHRQANSSLDSLSRTQAACKNSLAKNKIGGGGALSRYRRWQRVPVVCDSFAACFDSSAAAADRRSESGWRPAAAAGGRRPQQRPRTTAAAAVGAAPRWWPVRRPMAGSCLRKEQARQPQPRPRPPTRGRRRPRQQTRCRACNGIRPPMRKQQEQLPPGAGGRWPVPIRVYITERSFG